MTAGVCRWGPLLACLRLAVLVCSSSAPHPTPLLPPTSSHPMCRLKPDYADAHCDLGCTYCAQVRVPRAGVEL